MKAKFYALAFFFVIVELDLGMAIFEDQYPLILLKQRWDIMGYKFGQSWYTNRTLQHKQLIIKFLNNTKVFNEIFK